jgi:hypothetical protein
LFNESPEVGCRIADEAKPWLCRGRSGDVQELLETEVMNGVF